MKDLPGSLGKEHIIQNSRKNGVLCLCLLIKGNPIPEEGTLEPPAPSHSIALVMQPQLSLPCQEDALGKSLWEITEHVSLEHPYSSVAALAGPSHVCARMQDLGTWLEAHTFLFLQFCSTVAFPKAKSWSKGHPAFTLSASWGRALTELGRGVRGASRAGREGTAGIRVLLPKAGKGCGTGQSRGLDAPAPLPTHTGLHICSSP